MLQKEIMLLKLGTSREDNLMMPQTALMLQFGSTVSDIWGASRKRILQGERGNYKTRP
jgi:hypothetical protein